MAQNLNLEEDVSYNSPAIENSIVQQIDQFEIDFNKEYHTEDDGWMGSPHKQEYLGFFEESKENPKLESIESRDLAKNQSPTKLMTGFIKEMSSFVYDAKDQNEILQK